VDVKKAKRNGATTKDRTSAHRRKVGIDLPHRRDPTEPGVPPTPSWVGGHRHPDGRCFFMGIGFAAFVQPE
jgi:hypothetical protein